MWKLDISYPIEKEVQEKAEGAFDRLSKNQKIGFKDISRMEEAIKFCHGHASFLRRYKKIVVLGVGGSSLGTKALCDSLFGSQWQDKIIFLDSVDSTTVDSFLESISKPQDYGWVLCSKSGATIEVLSLYEYCYNALKKIHNFSIIEQSLIVTESKESPLFDFSKKHNISQISIPLDVGGRFSAFTAIGLLPLQFLNFDHQKTQKGLEWALQNKSLVSLLAASLLMSLKKEENNFYCFQYSDRMSQWSLWLQQLWSESLSKKEMRSGGQAPVVSTFIPCRGVSDQHSVLQQIIEGQESKLVCFHRILATEKSRFSIDETLFENSLMQGRGIGDLQKIELEATQQAVVEAGLSTLVLTAEEISEETMAALMGLWMMSVGVVGEALDVNAFDQPGVESGKIIARRVLTESH